jgi:hypothetical protein
VDDTPIFIAGLERSGTSLIYALLGSHPNISMTRRTNFWRFFNKRFGDLSKPENLELCMQQLRRYRRVQVLRPDFDRLRQEFEQGDLTYPRLFALLERQHAERAGKPRWGDKSLYTERFVREVFAGFPSAQILHIIRDPRDRYASVVRRWKGGKGRVGAATATWVASIALAERNRARYPGRYMIVRYESLATQPEETLQEICSFIGEAYSPAMLQMNSAATFRDAGGNSSYGKREAGRVTANSVGRFRDVVPSREIAFMQAVAGRRMRTCGYELEPIHWTLAERLRFLAVDCPMNFARMAGWHAKEAARDLAGRRPSAHTILSGRTLTTSAGEV